MTDDELVEYYKGFDVIWFSNPGMPINDTRTVLALETAMDLGVGIVLQGDDMMYTELWPGIDMTPLTGLDPYSYGLIMTGVNNTDGKTYDNRYYFRGIGYGGYYDVTVGSGHVIQAGLEGQMFEFGDDIDLATIASGYDVTPVLTATPVPTDIGYPEETKPTVTAYIDMGGNREVTILLTLTQPEITTDIDVSKLCDNIILWVSGTVS